MVNYQRKSLEMSQRKYFVLRDLLEASRGHFDMSRQHLAGILKNSALPDIVKMQISENYGQMVENQLLGKAQESVEEGIGKLIPRMRENLQVKVKDFASDLNGQVLDTVDQISMMQEASEDMDEAGMNKLSMAGEMGGSMGLNWLFGKVARRPRSLHQPE